MVDELTEQQRTIELEKKQYSDQIRGERDVLCALECVFVCGFVCVCVCVCMCVLKALGHDIRPDCY